MAVGRRFCTEFVDPSALQALLACQLIPLNKRPGVRPIGICEVLRRILGKAIMTVITLFNRSFSEGRVPEAWKEALVVPVHKGGPRSCPGNYRPIALLSIVSKTMEKIVLKQLSAFLGPLLSPKQSGFHRGNGTSPQLIRLVRSGQFLLTPLI